MFGDPARNNRGSASVVVQDTVWFVGTASDGVDGSDDIYLHCIAPDGHILWSQTYGDSRNEYVNNMIRCSDGNLYIVGDVRNPFTDDLNGFLLAVDTAGEVLWNAEFGDPDLEEDFYNVDCSGDAALAVTGFITDTLNSGNDILLARYTLSGDLLNTLQFGAPENDYGMGIVCLPGGNVLLSGDRQGAGGDYHAFFAKVLPDNSVLFDVPITDTYNSGCKNMHLQDDGTVYVCGESASALDPQFDVLFVRVDTMGNILAENRIPYPGSEAGYDIVALPGNRYGITGFGFDPASGENELLFTIVDAEGEELSRTFYGLSGADLGYDIQADAEGNVWMSGFITHADTVFFALVFSGASTHIQTTAAPLHSLSVFPNPVVSCFSIRYNDPIRSVQVYDMSGKLIGEDLKSADGQYCLPEPIAPGVYLLGIRVKDGVIWEKIIAG